MRLKSIQELLKFEKDQLCKIEGAYNLSLKEKEIKPELQIWIKCYLEGLRSCLDYCAKDIYEIVLSGNDDKKVLYFPVRKSNTDFENTLNGYLPGLKNIHKNIFDLLEKYQPYHNDFEWLGDFATLTNDNKHQDLVPQERKETKGFSVKKTGQKEPIATFRNCFFGGNGNHISIDGVPMPIDLNTQFPVNVAGLDIERKIWVDFIFQNISKSALPLLKQFYDGIEKIIKEIYVQIESGNNLCPAKIKTIKLSFTTPKTAKQKSR